MGNDFFEDDDFRDNPVEMENGKWKEVETAMPAQPTRPVAQRPAPQSKPAPKQPEPLYENIDLEFNDDEEDDYTVVLSDARLRLEQGKLYELIMNSNLFDNMDSDARAIRNVQREIKRFARERMEVMLGMRQEAARETSVASPFNSLEVDVLKKIASAASKGATEQPEAEKATWDNPPQPKKQSLTPISSTPKPQPQKLTAKPKAPIARVATTAPIVKEEYEPLKKDPSQMSADELIERNKQAAERQARVKPAKSSDAKPMPSYEQQEMLHADRMANTNVSIGRTPTPVSAILAAINQSKK